MSSKNFARFHLTTLLVSDVFIGLSHLVLFKSHLVGTGMRGYNLPATVKLVEVHRCSPHHLLAGTREIDGPTTKRECEVRLEQLCSNEQLEAKDDRQ
jgi:hypothetical protein